MADYIERVINTPRARRGLKKLQYEFNFLYCININRKYLLRKSTFGVSKIGKKQKAMHQLS